MAIRKATLGAALAIAVLVTMGVAGPARHASAATPLQRFEPADGVVYSGATAEDPGPDLSGFLTESGQPSVALYSRFTARLGSFSGLLDDCRQLPVACVISWGVLADSTTAPGGTLASVAAGDVDSYLLAQLASARTYGGPVFIRPNWEMNAWWMPWAAYAADGTPQPGNSPAEYRKVFQRLKVLIDGGTPAEINAKLSSLGMPSLAGSQSVPASANVALVWSTSGGPAQPTVNGVTTDSFYPGDAYVDWVGMSAYAWGNDPVSHWATTPGGWNDFYQTYSVGHGKPMMFSEWGVWAQPTGSGDNAAWVTDAFAWMQQHPKFKAQVYFNIDASDGDHRLQSFPQSAAAFRQAMADARWVHDGQQVTTAAASAPSQPSSTVPSTVAGSTAPGSPGSTAPSSPGSASPGSASPGSDPTALAGLKRTGRSLYFAEGYTGPGFQEYLTLLNPAQAMATVQVSYLFTNAAPLRRTYTVGSARRFTIDVNHEVGAGREVAIHIDADQAIAAERPVYFTYHGLVTGGSTTAAVSDPMTTWYFAEGHVGDGFDEYLTMANPGTSPVQVEATYQFLTGAPAVKSYTVPAQSRYTVTVGHEVGPGDVSVALKSSGPMVAERPMYFNYLGRYLGGSTSTGAAAPGSDWYFAEGYTGAGFDEYLTIANPSSSSAPIDITFSTPDGQATHRHLDVAAAARVTVKVADVVGLNKEVSAHIYSPVPVVAERPLYVDYHGIRSGSTGAGSRAPTTGILFAEGYTGAGFDEYVVVHNPATTTTDVDLTYLFTDGTSSGHHLTLPAGGRQTVRVNDDIGPGREVSVRVTASAGVVAERPMYFTFRGQPGTSVESGIAG